MITWWAMLAMAAGVYAQRLVGMFLLDTEKLGERGQSVVSALPLAIIAGVVALQTFSEAGDLTLDPRIAGLGVAVLCAWRRLPLAATVIAAAATTAVLRALL